MDLSHSNWDKMKFQCNLNVHFSAHKPCVCNILLLFEDKEAYYFGSIKPPGLLHFLPTKASWYLFLFPSFSYCHILISCLLPLIFFIFVLFQYPWNPHFLQASLPSASRPGTSTEHIKSMHWFSIKHPKWSYHSYVSAFIYSIRTSCFSFFY